MSNETPAVIHVTNVARAGNLTGKTSFSASDSALGYLYQLRVALLWALRRFKADNEFVVSLETLDDVSFESNDKPQDLLQTKHHLNSQATLTDASPDLWKSLRVWFEGYAIGKIPSGAALHLLTTAAAPPGSIASHLRTEQRDVAAALESLEATAQSSTNQTNASAYASFLAASEPTRQELIESVVVHDSSETVVGLDDLLQQEVRWAVERIHLETFLENLEGWWFRRCLKQLQSANLTDRISSAEIEAQMSELREQFKRDALPIDEELISIRIDDATLAAHSSSRFVKQLDLIDAGKRRIIAAVRDYLRAFEQRSRWLRRDLLLVGDLEKYERRLVEEWELVFEGITDELGESAAESAKKKAARDVLRWAEMASIPIRPNVTEPFVTRGSLHMLADESRIGWHPEFRARLAALLQPESAATT